MSITHFNTPVSENVERIIREKGMKQNSVAERAGYTPKELSDMLNGRKIIKVNDAPRLANALGVGISDLFRFTEAV